MKKAAVLFLSHMVIGFLGFALGIYALPILTAPKPPTTAHMQALVSQAEYRGRFKRDLTDSDFLHWGEGDIYISDSAVTFQGRLAPGPDYKLYFSPKYVETEAEFLQLKSQMVRAGDIKTFDNFELVLPETINPADYQAVIVWCESFGQFISASRYSKL